MDSTVSTVIILTDHIFLPKQDFSTEKSGFSEELLTPCLYVTHLLVTTPWDKRTSKKSLGS